jgi:preprotein translocase subunit SecF
LKEERIIPFLNYKYYAYGLSIGMFVIFMAVAIFYRGGLRMGVDFVGGQKIVARFEKGVDEAKIRKALDNYSPLVQQIGEDENNEYIISTKLSEEETSVTKEKMLELIKKKYPRMAVVNDEVIVLSLKNAGDEQKITALLAARDAVVRKIEVEGKNDYLIYKKESINKKKSNYNADVIKSTLKSGIDEIDFLNSVSIFALFDKQVDEPGLKAALKKLNASFVKADYTAKQGYVIYKIAVDESEKIKSELAKKFKQVVIMGVENVGPAVGAYLSKSALKLLAVAIILMMIYLAYRFEIRYAMGAMVAVLHDVILSVAFCGIAGIEINIPIIAALLTIFGYSVNDTIVIFDRIRESTQIQTKMSFIDIINKSITLTMSRTILTSFLTLLTVFALYLLGGEGLTDFAAVLLFGMLVGVYSTVYIASPVVISWENLMLRLRSR